MIAAKSLCNVNNVSVMTDMNDKLIVLYLYFVVAIAITLSLISVEREREREREKMKKQKKLMKMWFASTHE